MVIFGAGGDLPDFRPRMGHPPSSLSGNVSRAEFPPTHWTAVLRAGGNLPQNTRALNELCARTGHLFTAIWVVMAKRRMTPRT